MPKLKEIINEIEVDRIYFRPLVERKPIKSLTIARRKDEINLKKYLEHEVEYKTNYEKLGLDIDGKEVLTPYKDLTIYY